MLYLITGGNGFIGSGIVDKLFSDGDEVISLYNNNNDRKFDESIIKIKADITDGHCISKICKEYDIDGIFHTAAIMGTQASGESIKKMHDINENGTFNILNAASDSGVNKVVFSSSSAVYGDTKVMPQNENMKCNPLSYYGYSKLIAELYLNAFHVSTGISSVTLRYFNVYGPNQNVNSSFLTVIPLFIKKILSHESITLNGGGNQTRDFVYIDDVIDANIRAMKSDVNGVYNIGNGVGTSIKYIADIIMKITKIEVPVNNLPARKEEIMHSVADISSANNSFGFVPKTSVEDGITKTIEYYQTIYNKK